MAVDIPKTKAQVAECLRDKSWRMNHLYSVVDESGEKVRYNRRDIQSDFADGRHGLDVVLKSRQHGLSTETELDILDDAINTPNLQCGIIAHTKIDAQNLFETKVKLPYHELPALIRGLCPAVKCDAGTLRLSNGSEIRVAVSFRSATTHRLHISEYGEICAKFPLRADEIKTGTLPSIHPQLGGRVVIEGTAHGAGGHFYELCTQAQADTANAEKEGRLLNPLQYKFHFYPWYKDPKNTVIPLGIAVSDELRRYFERLADEEGILLTAEQKAWYAIKRDGAGGLGSSMKREQPSTVAEAFEQSVEGAIFAEELERARSDGRIGFYPFVRNVPVHTFWDLGYRNATCVGFVQFIKEQVRIIDFYSEMGRGATYHAGQINKKDYQYAEHHMPHDVMNHEKGSGIVLKDTYQSLLKAPIRTVPRPSLKQDSITALKDMFDSLCFNAKTTVELVRALAFYRYEWDEEKSVFSKEPQHDWASDPADMMQYLGFQYRFGSIGGKYLGSPVAIPVAIPRHQEIWERKPLLEFGRVKNG